MEWLAGMNNALSYIEDNLADEISFDRVAQAACCSSYHFQRMFSFIAGVPLAEYIRRRRLTLAAVELQTSDAKVIDVAVKYGYESPEAFSRAFKKLHGIAPTLARDVGVSLKVFPKISFHISIKGDVEMNYRIEERETFEVMGMELKTTVVDGKCYEEIPKFVGECIDGGLMAEVGVTYGHNENGNMNYLWGCFKKTDAVPSRYTVLNIPKQTWAVFHVDWQGDDGKLHDTWKRIYSEWFPTVSYVHADCEFDFEKYFEDEGHGYIEIWIPVVKK
ncbi:MAG: AraC family transcriptional regulator [Defluviitaleaceae bacterium]|nr:AraC family transcriptional regulator [Defluviitaleaceae bacterium]